MKQGDAAVMLWGMGEFSYQDLLLIVKSKNGQLNSSSLFFIFNKEVSPKERKGKKLRSQS